MWKFGPGFAALLLLPIDLHKSPDDIRGSAASIAMAKASIAAAAGPRWPHHTDHSRGSDG